MSIDLMKYEKKIQEISHLHKETMPLSMSESIEKMRENLKLFNTKLFELSSYINEDQAKINFALRKIDGK